MKLASQRYEQIKETIAEFLEDYDVKKIPVDVFELARKMNIKLVFASEILERHPKKVDEYLLFSFPNSYLYYDPETQKFIIYIDDVGTRWKRQRFSLAHELVHIILGHTEQNEENEAEANFGATYLLAPTSLALMHLNNDKLFDAFIVGKIFDVSEPEAQIIVRYNSNRVCYCDLKAKHYEKTINNLFKDSLNHMISKFN
ncbi:MAG: ImmA/IrrE family metallo-endopeptidase [Bacilli bacterium]|nr:ImmA/IrrE family metallo-endopeptidase [Bacilli bacterium]